MKTSPKRYENVDWQRVRKVLVFRATQLSLASGQSPDGAPPGHLADEVLTDFFLHPDGLDWEPKKGRLETFLRRMLDTRWIDQSRDCPEAELEPGRLLETIRRPVKGEPDLVELLEAVEMLDGDCGLVNEELATLIGTTVADVENRKKRLRRALSEPGV